MSEREISIPTVAARCLCLLCSLARLLCVSFFFAGTTATQTQKSKLNFAAPINGEIFMQKSTTGWSVIGWLGCGCSHIAFLLLGLRVVQIQSIAMQTGPRLIPPFQITSRYNKAREQMEKKGQKPREQNGPGGMGEAKGGNTKKMSKKGKKKKKESRACTTKPIIWNCRDTKRCLFGFFV